MYNIIAQYRTGSNFICDPPVCDTDIDIIILVDRLDQASQVYIDNGWTETIIGPENKGYKIEQGYGVWWKSFKQDNINHIIISNSVMYIKWVAATLLAKELNLTNKTHRVCLHRLIKNTMGFEDFYEGPIPGENY